MAGLANKRRETEVFSLAFLDCICCGFGAVLLVFILTVSQKKNVDRADVDLARDRLAQARAASSASEADLDRLAALTKVDGSDVVPVRRLAAVLGLSPVAADAVSDRLKLSNRDRQRLLAAASAAIGPSPDPQTARTTLYREGAQAFVDQVYLRWAEAGGNPNESAYAALLDVARCWTPPVFPLSGEDVLALGFERGPKIGELLGEVERWWVDTGFSADRGACLARLRALTQT